MKLIRLILSICFSISLVIPCIIFVTPIFIICKVPKKERKIFNFAMEVAVRVTNNTMNDKYKEIMVQEL